MTDVQRMEGRCDPPQQTMEQTILTGKAPVSTMRNYARELLSYSKGKGRISLVAAGYDICHDPETVMEKRAYDPGHDLRNPADSVFCEHGAGFVVPWDEVKEHMHLPSIFDTNNDEDYTAFTAQQIRREQEKQNRMEAARYGSEEEELAAIFERTYGPVKQRLLQQTKKVISPVQSEAAEAWKKAKKKQTEPGESYLLVDGYNIVFAWEELKELAQVNIDAARGRLMDILCDYQGSKGCHVILVFDAYKVRGGIGQMQHYHNIDVVYTKEAETADQYIAKAAHTIGKNYNVTVATSDGLVQLIVWGQECLVWSAGELFEEVNRSKTQIREQYLEKPVSATNRMADVLQNSE